MVCSVCGVEMRITGCEVMAQGDDSPEKVTQVWAQQTLVCKNPHCTNRVPIKIRHLLYESAAASEEKS